eukprot:gene33868-45368_t
MHYVTKTVEKNLAKQAQSRKRFTLEGNSKCHTTITTTTTPFTQPASNTTSKEEQVSKTGPRKKVTPAASNNETSTLLEEAATSDAVELVDVMLAPWNVVWKILRSSGWTWDFGNQTNNWYIAPGYTVKTAVPGEQKFADELAVRRHVRKLNMPEFKSVSDEGKRSHISDSQMSIDVTDPQNDWQLALNRRKRKARQSVSDGKQSPNSKKHKHLIEEEEPNPSSRVNGHHHHKRKLRKSKKVTPLQSRAEEADTRISDGDNSGNDQSVAEEPTQAQRLTPSPSYAKNDAIGGAFGIISNNRASEKPIKHIEESKISSNRPFYSHTSSKLHKLPPQSAAARPFVSSSSSSSSSNIQTSRSLQNLVKPPEVGGIMDFAGLRFALCGYSEALKSKLSNMIKSRKGSIAEEITLNEQLYADEYEFEFESSHHKSRCILLSHPCDFRKPKYMMALASGCRLVHAQWIYDSISSGKRLSFAEYQLPAGYSALHSRYIVPETYPPAAQGLFRGFSKTGTIELIMLLSANISLVLMVLGVRVLGLAGRLVNRMLALSGADI